MRRMFIMTVFSLVALVACAPVISDNILRQVDSELSITQLFDDPEKHTGRIVLVGGKIVRASVEKEKTWVEVLEQPLGWRQRPKESDSSYGRYLVYFEDYRDTEIYQNGRLITIAGEVEGKEVRFIGKTKYAYPVLRVKESFLWKREDAASPRFHFGIGVGGTF